jgi:pyruvate dehydrogenase E2 component (dihydrolipoamide acetyltransferase)
MAVPIIMPQRGNSATKYVLSAWKKQPGDTVRKGEVLADVETDKAIVEIESPGDGTLLATFVAAGDEAATLSVIGAIGEPGEEVEVLRGAEVAHVTPPESVRPSPKPAPTPPAARVNGHAAAGTSPRARALAASRNVDLAALSLTGTGPDGRVIERDVRAALDALPQRTRAAQAAGPAQDTPLTGSGLGGRITLADLARRPAEAEPGTVLVPLRGVRRVTAERMLASLQTTAQLTLTAYVDARALRALRARLKGSPPALGLQSVTLNDLVLFAVTRMLPQFPELNAHFVGDAVYQFRSISLGFAVDTPRGLLVPVIHDAGQLSLAALSTEAHRLAEAAASGRIDPALLDGGTFTVSNLGSFGIETFTPVLNTPQVAILGVGAVHLKPVETEAGVEHWPHLPLSLTIDHQALDGAPAARFLQALAASIARIDLLLAL